MPYQLCILGCGTMGVAILSGVLDNLSFPNSAHDQNPNANNAGETGPSTPMGSLILDPSNPDSLPDRFIATVNRSESAKKLRRTFRDHGPLGSTVQVVQSDHNTTSVASSSVILLCCKPQMASSLLQATGMYKALQGKLLISILAGTTISQYREWVPKSCTVVRAMPNTPSKIREGMTVLSSLSPSDPETPKNRDILLALFTPLGRCRFMDEKVDFISLPRRYLSLQLTHSLSSLGNQHFDAVTAVCGSGPAFVCLVLEAIADGGVMMGLPRSEALELAAQTMQGAARMVLQTGMHPAALKDSVTTPGGCTIAGLLALEDGRVRSTVARCIQATALHAAGLGQSAVNK
ncbi:BQ5605_C008g05374 [Microbotryum silenes-dioicae]|uniref:BQ5605_C008g05374 protein n=1 Tax=Microbotryum silenes-dioicae TaxID=796604 RepID=A0A2X0P8C7_9BASI|nr:BQ5605_C008g05374 [Microbotryum silenes-dioicae]